MNIWLYGWVSHSEPYLGWSKESNNQGIKVQVKRTFKSYSFSSRRKKQTNSAWNFLEPRVLVYSRCLNPPLLREIWSTKSFFKFGIGKSAIRHQPWPKVKLKTVISRAFLKGFTKCFTKCYFNVSLYGRVKNLIIYFEEVFLYFSYYQFTTLLRFCYQILGAVFFSFLRTPPSVCFS